MSVNFEINSYYNVVKEKPNVFKAILNHTKSSVKFKCVDVEVQEFNKKYSSEGWFRRKVFALPAAIWSGVVKTIYHLAKAIIIGFLKALSDDGKYFQSQLFYTGRDLQESFGWLVSLLNDRYGQYHIQESGFHKSLYNYFLSEVPRNNNLPIRPFTVKKGRVPVIANTLLDQPSDKQSLIDSLKRDPSSFPNLKSVQKNDADFVVAALSGCTSAEQAKNVFKNAGNNAKNSKNVALALVKIDPTLLGQLANDATNNQEVVLLAIESSTEQTIQKIWSFVGNDAKSFIEVRTAVLEKYPNMFQHEVYQGPPTAHTQNTSAEIPEDEDLINHLESEDLKNNTSKEAIFLNKILKRYRIIELNSNDNTLSYEKAKNNLCVLLDISNDSTDEKIRTAFTQNLTLTCKYFKPHDRLEQSASFDAISKILTSVYTKYALSQVEI